MLSTGEACAPALEHLFIVYRGRFGMSRDASRRVLRIVYRGHLFPPMLLSGKDICAPGHVIRSAVDARSSRNASSNGAGLACCPQKIGQIVYRGPVCRLSGPFSSSIAALQIVYRSRPALVFSIKIKRLRRPSTGLTRARGFNYLFNLLTPPKGGDPPSRTLPAAPRPPIPPCSCVPAARELRGPFGAGVAPPLCHLATVGCLPALP